jgi:hypothetical protein
VLFRTARSSVATLTRRIEEVLNAAPSLPIYQSMTLRNWNTTTRLLRIMVEASGRLD